LVYTLLVAGIVFFGFDYYMQDREEEIADLENEISNLRREQGEMLKEIVSLREQIAAYSSVQEDKEVFELKGLVALKEVDKSIVVELIYATENNFTGQVLYNVELGLLQKETAEKLAEANAEFATQGYRLKVWDAYRPAKVQMIMWENSPGGVFVAHPDIGSDHNRGAAVDVTLIDVNGKELVMPTGFDDFTEKASRYYPYMTEEARHNMEYLTEIMVNNGFTPIRSEWWHFNDSNVSDYPHLNITLEDWVNAYLINLHE